MHMFLNNATDSRVDTQRERDISSTPPCPVLIFVFSQIGCRWTLGCEETQLIRCYLPCWHSLEIWVRTSFRRRSIVHTHSSFSSFIRWNVDENSNLRNNVLVINNYDDGRRRIRVPHIGYIISAWLISVPLEYAFQLPSFYWIFLWRFCRERTINLVQCHINSSLQR